MREHAVVEMACTVSERLDILGIRASPDLDALWKLGKVRDGIGRGQAVLGFTGSAARLTVLLEGVACFSSQHEDGDRQILAFYYPGDFLGLHTFMSPRSAELGEVRALASCSVGIIDRDALEQAMQRHPAVGRALWRAALIEANIVRQRLVTARRPALQRIAHLLCEQLVRIGIAEGVIPLRQIEIADAAILSVVHANRILQELRQLGLLSKRRAIEVVNRERLQELAGFDARYLAPSETLSRFDLRIDD